VLFPECGRKVKVHWDVAPERVRAPYDLELASWKKSLFLFTGYYLSKEEVSDSRSREKGDVLVLIDLDNFSIEPQRCVSGNKKKKIEEMILLIY
jgi:hypothetical protein